MMSGLLARRRVRRGFPIRLLAAAVTSAVLAGSPADAAPLSVQASWVSAATLDAPDGIRRAITSAVAAGVTTIVAPAPRYVGGGPDRFLELLRLAHEHHLQVFASIDVDRAVLADEVPAARDHVVYQHPEWLMVPRALAPELLKVDIRSPEYFGRLARWTRATGGDGVYVSPVPDDAAAFVVAAAASIVMRYPVDGVQLDAARYPAGDFDYSRRAIDAFRQDIRPSLTPARRAEVDQDETVDPFAYPNAFPEEWRGFRRRQLTRLVSQLRAAIDSMVPGIPVVAAVSGAADTDLENHLQDWRVWIERGLVDAVSVRSGTTTTIAPDVSAIVTFADAGSTPASR